MDKKQIVLSAVAAAVVVVGGIALWPSSKDLEAGAANGDKCIAELIGSIAPSDLVACAWSPVHMGGESKTTDVWLCNGAAVMGSIACLDAIHDQAAHGKPRGSIVFTGAACDAGVCWSASVRSK